MKSARSTRGSKSAPSRTRRAAARGTRTTTAVAPRVRAAKPAAESVSVASFLRRATLEGNLVLDCDGVPVPVTHLDRVYWPREGYTKGDLLKYYLRVARYILPHLANRPAILKRHPNGIAAPPFFQHDVRNAPGFLQTIALESETGRPLDYAVYDGLASLIYLTNLGTIAHNPWLSRVQSLDRPDFLALDLDPHGAPFENVVDVALALRETLESFHLRGYAKTSGSAGIHVFVPLADGYDFETVLRAAERIAQATVERVPKIATIERRIAERKKNQVYVDWQQNARGKSVASVYSVRAKPGATVSAALDWREVNHRLRLQDFTMDNVPERLRAHGDPWKDMLEDRQCLDAVR